MIVLLKLQRLLTFFLSFILVFLMLASAAFSAEEVLTLEEAKEMARGSRGLMQSELDAEKAKFEYYQAQKNYDDVKTPSYYNLLPYYFYLNEQKDQGINVDEQLKNVEKQISDAKGKLDAEADKAASARDTMESREIAYEDSKASKEKSEKQLDYQVEQMYTSILVQEDKMISMHKELDYKYNLLNIERKKLKLGNSTQEKVDKLAVDTSNFNKSIVEANNSLKNLKGKLNDLLGRDYDVGLKLVPFSVNEVVVIPVYNNLLPLATQNYDKLSQLEKNIEERKKDLDDDAVKDTAYQSDLIKIEIKKLELQIEDEKIKLKETINNLITDMNIKQKNYQLAKIDWENTQKNYERSQKRFGLGLISKLELLQSELDYLAGKNKYMSIGYDFSLAQNNLELVKQGIL
ncbi:MAG: hypothetical protein VR72_15385 [Clostridiaceae bacterium BRH_c20a]|nr:MAG: hypothetical protein VR72_15385 [Clostridiaceae bacterium BRH_c20a]